jgi:hypothetical protein
VKAVAVVASAILLAAASASAQHAKTIPVTVPTDADELDRRVARLLDSATAFPRDQLVRSPSSFLPASQSGVTPLAPALLVTRNSAFPYSANDGALWAGRGISTIVRGGVVADWGRVRMVLAPEIIVAANRAWLVFPSDPFFPPREYADRSYYSHFWYRLPRSIDAPYRFGPNHMTRLDAGQSSLMVRLGAARSAEVGISNENQWWGPGLRNALLLGTNAPGFPHLFARTVRPLSTRLGAIDARWLLGGLTESGYFDTVSTNNTRAYTAAAVVWHARDSSHLAGLSLGIARAVYANIDGWTGIRHHTFAIWSSTPRSQRVLDTDTTPSSGRDQITTLFGRWTFPRAGMEIHGELGRTELPISFRDALVFPEHTLGRTLGFQWARRLGQANALSVEGEITNTEQSASFVSRPIGIWYTSRTVPQGYTQRGQLLGAAIGPSGTSQWLAADFVAPTWRAGLVAQRIRWNNDFIDIHFSNVPVGFTWCHHDVTIAPGLRGAWRPRIGDFPLGRFAGEFLLQNRLNYFFQNVDFCPNNLFRRDLRNRALSLSWSL